MQLRRRWLGDCMPTIAALLMSGLYSVIDGLFIGRAVGDVGLAAVNLAWPIPAVITALGIGIGTGGSILYSNSLGKEAHGDAAKKYSLTVLLLIAAGLAATVALYLSYPGILKLLGAKGAVYREAADYSQIIVMGSVFQIVGAGIIPLMRNRGRAFGAMISMSIGMGSNIILNYLLIMVAGIGIRGAAIGTVAAQMIVIGISLGMKAIEKVQLRAWSLREAGRIIRTGISAFGLSLAPSVVLVFTNYRCLQLGGASAVACYAVISYITFPVQYILSGIGDGSQPLMSYFNGSGREEELRYIQKLASSFAAGAGVLLASLVCGAAPWIPGVFGMSEESARYFVEGMRISSLAFPLIGLGRFHIAYLGAVLKTRQASLLIYGETLAASPVFLIGLPMAFGIRGIWMSLAAVQAVMLAAYRILGVGQTAGEEAAQKLEVSQNLK